MALVAVPDYLCYRIRDKKEIEKFNVGDKLFINNEGKYQLLTNFERIVYKLKGQEIKYCSTVIDKNKDFIECATSSYDY